MTIESSFDRKGRVRLSAVPADRVQALLSEFREEVMSVKLRPSSEQHAWDLVVTLDRDRSGAQVAFAVVGLVARAHGASGFEDFRRKLQEGQLG